MFGGLSIKGEGEEKSSPSPPPAASSSGFSFLQSSIGSSTSSPSPSTPATTDNTVAANNSTTTPADPPSQPTAAPSAFSFMSGEPSSNNNTSSVGNEGQEEETSSVALKPRADAQPSMFAGLTTSSSASATTEPPPPPPQSSSETPSSGFSFLSSPASPQQPQNNTETNNVVETASTTTTAGGSSFSFMNSMASSSDNGGGDVSTSAANNDTINNSEGVDHNFSAVQEKKETTDAPSGGMSSGFSFLSGTSAPTSTTPAEGTLAITEQQQQQQQQPPSLIPETSSTTNPMSSCSTTTSNAPAPSGDLLSVTNASLPTGSGVSFGGAMVGGGPTKKVVKKKRGKRVGVGSAAQSIEPQQQSSFQPPNPPVAPPHQTIMGTPQTPGPSTTNWGNSTNSSNQTIPQMPSTPGHSTVQSMLPDSPPMRIKAERATNAAEEFIREKQRKQQSAIALAAERAMQDKGNNNNVGGNNNDFQRTDSGSGWKIGTNNNSSTTPGSPKNDDTYAAAKAAAEEAKKLADDHQGHAKGHKTSLFSSFFNRGKSNSSSAASTNNEGGSSSGVISSYSSHGGVVSPTPPSKSGFQRGGSSGSGHSNHSPLPPTRETLEISSYGSPRAMNDVEHGDDDDNNKMREMELQQQQQERQRLEHERQQQQLAEHRRRAEEKAAAEQQRRRKEEEERLEQQRIEAEKQRAPREKMQSILDHLADAARTATDDVTRLREARAKLVEDKIAAEKAERYAAQQLKFAETQQTVAAEEEDFEAADRLGTVIELHRKERDEQSRICRGITDSITKLDKEKDDASKSVTACFKEVQTKLAELQDEVDNRAKEEGVLSQFAVTSKRLSSETERLANDLKHIERDEKVLAEEEKELSELIGEETKEFDEKCLEASTKLDDVNKTIEDLRQQLAKAEAEAADLNKEISSYKASVETVKSKYSRQLGRLEKKSKSVHESRADWTSEKESIEKAKSAHEAVVAAHSEEMVTREKLIEDIKVECSTAKNLEEILGHHSSFITLHNLSDTEKTTNGEEGDDSCLLEGEVLKYEAVVNEANENLLAAETNIANLQEELSSIELRVPILEDLKKAAASKRDFKAAGKASKEIKDALARKEQCQAELAGDAMERKEFAKDELEKVTALLNEKKKIADEKGREAGLKEMDRLREKIIELKSIMKKFASTEEEDDAMNVSVVGAFVIESQICVLEAEGKVLGSKYGGWEDTADAESVQSAPTFDSTTDDSPEIVIDKTVLEKYISLRNEMMELEGGIKESVEQEDFDKAASLEERAQEVRIEFESCGFASDKFEQSLKDFMNKPESTDDICDQNNSQTEKVVDEDVLEKYSSLCADIKEWEGDIENAAADEDFEVAAELEEKVQSAKAEIESIGFSIDELEEALLNNNRDASDTPPSFDEGCNGVEEKALENGDATNGDIDEDGDCIDTADVGGENEDNDVGDENK